MIFVTWFCCCSSSNHIMIVTQTIPWRCWYPARIHCLYTFSFHAYINFYSIIWWLSPNQTMTNEAKRLFPISSSYTISFVLLILLSFLSATHCYAQKRLKYCLMSVPLHKHTKMVFGWFSWLEMEYSLGLVLIFGVFSSALLLMLFSKNVTILSTHHAHMCCMVFLSCVLIVCNIYIVEN